MVVLAACGRVGFDESSDGVDSGASLEPPGACAPLAAPSADAIAVRPTDDLIAVVAAAPADAEIALAAGEYVLERPACCSAPRAVIHPM